jgi:hypothetical protein
MNSNISIEDGKLTFKKMIKFIMKNDDNEYSSIYFNMIKDFIKSEYLMLEDAKLPIFWDGIVDYVDKYKKIPNYQQLTNVVYFNNKKIKPEYISAVINSIKDQDTSVIENNNDFAKSLTQEFIKDKATEHILTSSAQLFINQESNEDMDSKVRQITEWFDEVSAISLNPDLGDEYYSSAVSRHKALFNKTSKIPYALNYLNNCTLGGAEKGRLTMYFLSSGVGKTWLMSNDVSHILKETDKKVLYISLEDPSVLGRVDQNLLNKTKEELMKMSEEDLIASMEDLQNNYDIKDRFMFKHFPAKSVTISQIGAFIKELNLKRGFKVDTVFIDYLNLLKETKGNSLYEMYGYMSAEAKGMSSALDIDLRSAVQTNRDGFANKQQKMVTDIFLSEMADSIAVVFNSDVIIGGFVNEILKAKQELCVKMLKNRIYDYCDIKAFVKTDVKRQKVWDDNIPIEELTMEQESKMLDKIDPSMEGKDWGAILNDMKLTR